jgi:hypothetical protein
MKLTRLLYKAARVSRDLEVFLSGDIKKVARRMANKRIIKGATSKVRFSGKGGSK